MCGIAGVFAYRRSAAPVDREELTAIRDSMARRGPDGAGTWIDQDGRVGLGHRRLSIIDLSDRALQPMASADGRRLIVFNGEIYNYVELRRELEEDGHAFRTTSDTEVLLALYEKRGADMVQSLRGMFAFGLWDADKQGLLLVRDPYGIKPLYYADDGATLRFASQAKALRAGGKVSDDPDPAGWVGFFLFGSVPEPYTVHKSIRALPAGTLLWVDSEAGVGHARPFFSIAEAYREAEARDSALTLGEVQECVREALLESVRYHLVADVPVGAFLSSGVDSSALVALMRDLEQDDIRSVTVAFEEFQGKREDETRFTDVISRRYRTDHVTRFVSSTEFREDLPKIVEAMDQPTIDGVNTWFASKAIHERGLKVAVSGLGGDELFGGYPSFSDIPRWVRIFAPLERMPPVRNVLRRIAAGIASVSDRLSPKAAGLPAYGGSYAGAYLLRRGLFMPWELPSVMDPDMAKEGLARFDPLGHIAGILNLGPERAFGKIAALEASLYMRNQLLRDTDWASMAHSVEVRVPLVDVFLLRRLASVLGEGAARHGKQLLASSPSLKLPDELVSRPKTGFTTPLDSWLRADADIQRWKRVAYLGRPNTHWARRWACEVAGMGSGALGPEMLPAMAAA